MKISVAMALNMVFYGDNWLTFPEHGAGCHDLALVFQVLVKV